MANVNKKIISKGKATEEKEKKSSKSPVTVEVVDGVFVFHGGKCVRLHFQICIHADTDICGISSHTINPFLLVIILYAICTKKIILYTNIQ